MTPIEQICAWTAAGVRRADQPDLSARQTAVLLTIYTSEEPRTVRGLAAHLNVSKPAITRAFDRLVELGLMKRVIENHDHRSVRAERTSRGTSLVIRMAQDWPSAPSTRAPVATTAERAPAHV